MIEFLKKWKRKIEARKTRINFYRFSETKLPISPGLTIGIAKTPEEFRQTLEKFRLHLHSRFPTRFKRGDWFVYLTDSNDILCYGWVLNTDRFHHFEIDKTTCHRDNRLLFDFVTPEKFRKRGYYAMLIGNLPAVLNDTNLTIGAVSTNIASNKGIVKAGYIPFEMEFCEER